MISSADKNGIIYGRVLMILENHGHHYPGYYDACTQKLMQYLFLVEDELTGDDGYETARLLDKGHYGDLAIRICIGYEQTSICNDE